MESSTIIIVLLLIIICLYIWDINSRDGFTGIGGQFFNVDYNTKKVICDNLTGTDPCVVQTVTPKRKEVCTKKLNFISPTERLGETKGLLSEVLNRRVQLQDSNSNENGMSLDQMDDIEDEMYSREEQIDYQNDNVSYDLNEQKEINNIKIKKYMGSEKKYIQDDNTLSDVDDELLSIN